MEINMKKTVKIVIACYLAVVSMLLFGANGMAYIDPSVVTYMIQAIAGIIIAIGAVVGIYWRSAKKKMAKKMGIDENKNKEFESDDITVD